MAIIKTISPVHTKVQQPDPDILAHLEKMDWIRARKAFDKYIKEQSKFPTPKKQAI